MHCPNCGDESSLEQKFCRKCGFNLEPIGKLFVRDDEPKDIELTKAERESLLVRHMFRWMSWGGIVLLLGVALLMINKTFILDRSVNLAAGFLLLTGTVLAGYGVFSAIGRGTKLTLEKPREKPSELRSAETTNELTGASGPAPLTSITERTTQLIAADEKQSRD